MNNQTLNDRFVMPDWFIVGLKFKSNLFLKEVTVLNIDITRNNVDVEVYYAGAMQPAFESWDLSITLWSFRNMKYNII